MNWEDVVTTALPLIALGAASGVVSSAFARIYKLMYKKATERLEAREHSISVGDVRAQKEISFIVNSVAGGRISQADAIAALNKETSRSGLSNLDASTTSDNGKSADKGGIE